MGQQVMMVRNCDILGRCGRRGPALLKAKDEQQNSNMVRSLNSEDSGCYRSMRLILVQPQR
jgi:hypothetical protein